MKKAMTNADYPLTLRLQELSESSDCLLTREVAAIILREGDGDHSDYLHGVLNCGCVSGYVNALCFYNQTHAFYDRNYDDIEQLREEYEDETGEPFRVKGDLKNFYAWFAFELIAFRIASDMGW